MKTKKESRRLSQIREAKSSELKRMLSVTDYAYQNNITVQTAYARIDAKAVLAVKKWNVIFIVPE